MKKSYSYIGISGGYKLLKKIKITYTDDHTNVVAILPHKDTGLYSYINLTKGHICPCCFASVEEALKDLSHYPNIKKWEIINEEIEEEITRNDLISRKAIIEEISSLQVTVTGLRAGKGVMLKYMKEYRKSVLKCIDEAPTAYDSDLIKCGIAKCRMVHKYEHPGYENNLCAGLRTLNGEGEPCETCKECFFYYGNPKWNEGECI